jgi:hypothetical protein
MVCGTILAMALLVRVETGNADATIPNTFIPGTIISSSQMNDNFPAVAKQMPAVKQVLSGTWMSIPIQASGSQLTSISFTPKRDGYVTTFATRSVAVDTIANTTAFTCIDLDVTSGYTGGCTPLGGSGTAYRSSFPNTFPVSGDLQFPYTLVKTIVVSSGVTYTYYLNGYATGMTVAYLFQPNIVAIYTPNLLP